MIAIKAWKERGQDNVLVLGEWKRVRKRSPGDPRASYSRVSLMVEAPSILSRLFLQEFSPNPRCRTTEMLPGWLAFAATYLGAMLSACFHESFDDSRVDGEEVVSCHSWLPRHSSRYDHHFCSFQASCQVLWPLVSCHCVGCVAVAEIGRHTCDVSNVVQGEIVDPRVHLQQERQRLSDATTCTEDGHFPGFHGGLGALCAHLHASSGLDCVPTHVSTRRECRCHGCKIKCAWMDADVARSSKMCGVGTSVASPRSILVGTCPSFPSLSLFHPWTRPPSHRGRTSLHGIYTMGQRCREIGSARKGTKGRGTKRNANQATVASCLETSR